MDEWSDVSDALPPITTTAGPEHPVGRRRRDWRWWVGGLGRILIALGVLLLGFVAYQLWGTAFEHDRAQRDLEQEFAAQLATTVPPATTTTAAPPPTSTPITTVTPTTVAPTTEAPTTAPPRPVFTNGDPVARLEIPRIGLDEIVVAGVSVDDLKKGPGHYPQTPLPGEPGNAAIAGHRTTYGAPFYDIDNLQPGDEIVATTYAGRYVYKVSGTQTVSPSDVSVLDNTPDDRITLTSCDPKYSAKNRIIVTAGFDAPSSSPMVGASPPPATAPPPTAAPPVSSPDNPVVTTAPPVKTAPPVATTAPSQVSVDDSFQRGWFDDPDAWPQLILWGLGCLAIVLGGWWIGRRTHHRWIGWVAAFLPFLVPLYFFYENVARLLPPNI
ncbi:MAG TPA: class E sortase [Acidimicrobiales bacterium]|nr:class E sortase [Acidimicrobiales bacterium]